MVTVGEAVLGGTATVETTSSRGCGSAGAGDTRRLRGYVHPLVKRDVALAHNAADGARPDVHLKRHEKVVLVRHCVCVTSVTVAQLVTHTQ